MPRVTVSKEEVTAAFEKLLSRGEAPSAENIYSLLGKGALSTINRYIRDIITESNQAILAHQEQLEVKTEFTPPPLEIMLTPNVQKTESLALAFEVEQQHLPSRQELPFTAPVAAPSMPTPTQVRKKRTHYEERRPSEPEIIEPPLESLPEETLVIKVRRLESMLLKEQARREASERISLDARTYAEQIKAQVAERINDLKQTMEHVIEQLKQQLKEQKHNYEQDLRFYREQLQKGNQKLISLLGK